METLSKQQAIKAMQSGLRVKHENFSNDEFIYMVGGKIHDENGYLMECEIQNGIQIDFWYDRQGSEWETGWSIVHQEAKKGESYWGDNGIYQEEYNRLWNELVPQSGEAESEDGELIRAIGRLYYEYCNNGNCNALDEKYEDVEYDCCECNGSGFDDEGEECSECCGSGSYYESEVFESGVSEMYQGFMDYISERIPEAKPLLVKVTSIIKYNSNNFSDENMVVYDNIVNLIIEHIFGRKCTAEVKNVQPATEKVVKPTVKLLGEDSNVFNLLGICVRALKKSGMVKEADELKQKVMNSESYDEALCLMMEYCEVE